LLEGWRYSWFETGELCRNLETEKTGFFNTDPDINNGVDTILTLLNLL
jgi:hypothetical protein